MPADRMNQNHRGPAGACGCAIRAAVSTEAGAPFHLDPLLLEPPRQDEVLVRVVATGICHTDVAMRDVPGRVPRPVVLGHEAAGVVEAVGAAVRTLRPGDHVVASFAWCGTCSSCTSGQPAYCRHTLALNFGGQRADGSSALSRPGGERVHGHFFGQSSFATHALCQERNLVPVPRDLALETLGPLGCGLQTGAGTVLNVLGLQEGQTIAIVGVGSVGLAAVMAARIAGAARIVALDVHQDRLALARELGATDAIDTAGGNVEEAMQSLLPSGVDRVVDTSGHVPTVRAAVAALAPLGRCALVSSARGADIPLNALHLMLGGRSVVGVHQGGSVPRRFIPELIEHHRAGRFPFEKLLTFYPFERINDAMEDLARGRVLKPVIRMSPSEVNRT